MIAMQCRFDSESYRMIGKVGLLNESHVCKHT